MRGLSTKLLLTLALALNVVAQSATNPNVSSGDDDDNSSDNAPAENSGDDNNNNNSTNENLDTTSMLHSPGVYPGIHGGRTNDPEWADAYSRARKFVSKMNLLEKVNMTTSIGWMNGPCVANTGDIPRLSDDGSEVNGNEQGFRGLCMQDGPLGVRFADLVDAFPAGITVGSTFNKNLMYDRAAQIGREHKEKGSEVVLGPAVGPLGTKAQGGRNWEAFGSDPYLQGIAGGLSVKGLQDQGVMANAKHWLMNEQEIDRNTISSNVYDRALRELYAWPFADMIHEGLASVMCSYNLINNSYGCENSALLNGVLKDEMGFQGFVLSDWGAQHSGINAAVSGLDLTAPGGGLDLSPYVSHWGWNMTKSVANGTLPMDRLNDMCTRIMAAYYKVGLDKTRKNRHNEPPNFSSWTKDDYGAEYQLFELGPQVLLNKHVDVRNADSKKISYDVTKEALTLLKNFNNTLPLDINNLPKKIAVLGKAAQGANKLTPCADQGCSYGALQGGWGSGQVDFTYFISPFDAINSKFTQAGSQVDYNFADTSNDDDLIQSATYSDLNIIFGMTDSGEGYIEFDGNPGDRKNTSLWHNAEQVIEAALKVNTNNIIVISSVGAVDMEKFVDHPNCTAVLFTLPPGDQGGKAIPDVLVGEYNPSGRLPFTIAKDPKDYLPLVNTTNYASNGFPQDNTILDADLYVDYRHFDKYNIVPRFEFGFGLSYSNFTFSNLYIQPVKPPALTMPEPSALTDSPDYDETIPSADELVFPDNMERIRGFIYPYLNSTSDADKSGTYPFPDSYSDEQQNKSHQAGGYSGGNKALWDLAYRAVVNVQNNGPYDGDYVAQLYIGFPESDKYPTPPKQLRGFDKLSLANCQTGQAHFNILTRDLTVWDTISQNWIVQRGTYTIYVGSSSRNLEVQGTFTL